MSVQFLGPHLYDRSLLCQFESGPHLYDRPSLSCQFSFWDRTYTIGHYRVSLSRGRTYTIDHLFVMTVQFLGRTYTIDHYHVSLVSRAAPISIGHPLISSV